MIQPICKDVIFLGRPCRRAAREDLPIGEDLLDTLRAHRQGCVGMAANMIGQAVRIIAVDQDGTQLLMFNPEILRRTGEYEAEEGCLSLPGSRKTTRFRSIKVPVARQDLHGLHRPDHPA